MNKTVTISARVSQEDAEFLSQLSIDNAKTPSDKFRAILSETRKRHLNQQDFGGNLANIQDMITPIRNQVREAELKLQSHSELVSRTLDWLPDTMALITSSLVDNKMDNEQLKTLENSIANHVFQLMESMLQLAVTQRAPCYTSTTINDRIDPLLDLLKAIELKQNSNTHKEELKQ